MRTVDDLDGGTFDVPDNPAIPMTTTPAQLESQLAELAKRLGSARYWALHSLKTARNDPANWRAEVRRLEAEFAKANARLQRKQKGNG